LYQTRAKPGPTVGENWLCRNLARSLHKDWGNRRRNSDRKRKGKREPVGRRSVGGLRSETDKRCGRRTVGSEPRRGERKKSKKRIYISPRPGPAGPATCRPQIRDKQRAPSATSVPAVCACGTEKPCGVGPRPARRPREPRSRPSPSVAAG
jgi:hypothetical protein